MYIVTSNPYGLDPKDFVVEGKRARNNKRSNIFLSKVIGRHLTVKPEVIIKVGEMLNDIRLGYKVSFPDPPDTFQKYHKTPAEPGTLVIGLADASLGLGMAVARCIESCYYVCTTHDEFDNLVPTARFVEEHSYAPIHNLYSRRYIDLGFDAAVIVEDEITTGASMLNTIKEIHRTTGIMDYSVLTIFDARTYRQRLEFNKLEVELGIKITVCHLFGCEIADEDIPEFVEPEVIELTEQIQSKKLSLFPRLLVGVNNGESYAPILHTGKFGLSWEELTALDDLCEKVADVISQDIFDYNFRAMDVLIIGHLDNIYASARVAQILSETFYVSYKTTIRSPICIDGDVIKDSVSFTSRGQQAFLYNTHEFEDYDVVVTLCDLDVIPRLCNVHFSYTL